MSSKKSAPEPSKAELRAEQTTAIATEIINRVSSARTEKTERLRAARLARDAEFRRDGAKSSAGIVKPKVAKSKGKG